MSFLGNKIFVTKKSHIKVDYLGKNKYHDIWIDTEKMYCLETTLFLKIKVFLLQKINTFTFMKSMLRITIKCIKSFLKDTLKF